MSQRTKLPTARLLFASLALVAMIRSAPCAAEVPGSIPLWPGEAPGEKGDIGEEKDTTTSKDGLIAGKPLIRLGNVSRPTLAVYRAHGDGKPGPAVIVCPGGGYHILAMDLEGTEVAEWLSSIGVTAIVLKYRVPVRHGRPRHEAPLQDAQRAVSVVRHHAAEWGIDPRRIGILGFSAGGHLSAVTSCSSARRAYGRIDAADDASCRPDFALLIYPAYLTVQEDGDRLPPELEVTSSTPPTFLVQTQDDAVRVESSVYYYLALRKAGVPAELHLYPTGGHGYGLRRTAETVTSWPARAEDWLRASKILGPK